MIEDGCFAKQHLLIVQYFGPDIFILRADMIYVYKALIAPQDVNPDQVNQPK